MVNPEYVIHDGYKIDAETGEVVEYVGVQEGFEVNSNESFEWVMEKIQSEQSDIAALNARKAALVANIDKMIRNHQQRENSLIFRFENELVHYAKENLPKGKKTFTCPYGSVSFRASAEKLEVTNDELALSWAKDHCPEAIKVTEKFLISQVPQQIKSEMMADETRSFMHGFMVKRASETHKIDTGI